MIIGSGLIARAFQPSYMDDDAVCIYAAGVSNSLCQNQLEFNRERSKLILELEKTTDIECFVYFSTCSIFDAKAIETPYVLHKLAMENLVMNNHPRSLILRLPQIAGNTSNPNTLLNFLYHHIARGESFNLWAKARRNILDIIDVVNIANHIIGDMSKRNIIVNIANSVSYSMVDVVQAMAITLDKPAIYNLIEYGSDYAIDISEIEPLLERAHVFFGKNYLTDVIGKYYEKNI